MAKAKLLVTQSGADTFTAGTINTGLTSDGKSGWQINSIEAFWVDGSTVAAADFQVNAIVSTINTATSFGDADEIDRVSWGLQNTGGVAVAVPYEPVREKVLHEPRLTVQPQIYCNVGSSASGIALDIIFVIHYEIVKLTDIDVLRLLAGGV
jgi:hypothetical protein